MSQRLKTLALDARKYMGVAPLLVGVNNNHSCLLPPLGKLGKNASADK
ncbi:hypothetical protein HA520_20030 [Azotobacter chroococcum]|uniref:Uncharacterized protein n=1 Tax=Azotobacter chroococcum TaxID=353 RepID=A0AA43ZBF4_9GAMM|nr:hypothetical protein [Azotobacter chroococcum]NHN79538.1 hypothetical protein [Azotobacter chroococcum]